jgi:hypothetical protein
MDIGGYLVQPANATGDLPNGCMEGQRVPVTRPGLYEASFLLTQFVSSIELWSL